MSHVTIPREPTPSLLRPFIGCNTQELHEAWAAMVRIAEVEHTRSGSRCLAQIEEPAPAQAVQTAPQIKLSAAVRGVGVVDDCDTALAVYFTAVPRKEDIRALHDALTKESSPQAAPALEAPAAKLSGMITVPFGLIGAACSAIDKKRDAPKLLAELRRYTVGDLSRALEAPAHQSLNSWFLSLPEGRQDVLRDDKWMLASAAYEAGRESRSALEAVPQAPAALDPRTPADMRVNGGALKLALNVLRRAGKNEVADELEKTAAPAAPAVDAQAGRDVLEDYRGPDDTPHPVLLALSEHDSPCDDTAEAIARIAALRAEIEHLRPFLLRAQAHQEAETDRLAARPSATTLNVLRVALERGNMPYRATGFKDHEIATAAEWVRAAQAKEGGPA